MHARQAQTNSHFHKTPFKFVTTCHRSISFFHKAHSFAWKLESIKVKKKFGTKQSAGTEYLLHMTVRFMILIGRRFEFFHSRFSVVSIFLFHACLCGKSRIYIYSRFYFILVAIIATENSIFFWNRVGRITFLRVFVCLTRVTRLA